MSNLSKSVVGSHPEVIESMLTTFFAKLDASGILWAVAHGWEGLPRYARHDVDLAVELKNVKSVEKMLRDSANETGWQIYGSFRNSGLFSYWMLLPGDEIAYFQIDVLTGGGMRGIPFFSLSQKDELNSRWRNESGIWCLPHANAGAAVFIKEMIAHSRVDGELRHQQIKAAISADGERFRALMCDAIKSPSAVDEITKICSEDRWGELTPYGDIVRRGVLRFRFRNVPTMVRYAYDYFRFRFFPYMRLFVAIVGPDGCGKTTIADGIINHFDKRPFLNHMKIHSNFGTIIRLREIKRFVYALFGKKIEFKPEPPPGTRGMGMKPPLGCLRSMFYVLYYGVFLALGRVQLWMWRTYSSLIVADRYYYDYYYMYGHSKSPAWFKDLVGLIVPKPQLVFFLDRPAEEIFAQKPELEISEIKRQQDVIRKLLKNDRRARVIDASRGVEETLRAVNGEIEKWLMAQKG